MLMAPGVTLFLPSLVEDSWTTCKFGPHAKEDALALPLSLMSLAGGRKLLALLNVQHNDINQSVFICATLNPSQRRLKAFRGVGERTSWAPEQAKRDNGQEQHGTPCSMFASLLR